MVGMISAVIIIVIISKDLKGFPIDFIYYIVFIMSFLLMSRTYLLLDTALLSLKVETCITLHPSSA
jgi:hypothetical protein